MPALDPISAETNTPVLQQMLDRGERIPAGTWPFLAPLLLPDAGARVVLAGVTLICVGAQPGYASGWAITTRSYRNPKVRSQGLVFDMTGGKLVVPDNGTKDFRAGLCIGWADTARLVAPRIDMTNGARTKGKNGFALAIREVTDLAIAGGVVNNVGDEEGLDGFHAWGTCRRVTVRNLSVQTHDDASSLTHNPGTSTAGDVQEDFLFDGCNLGNLGHSAVKGEITAPGTTIRRWRYARCRLKTDVKGDGMAAPISIKSLVGSGGVIEDVAIEGGFLGVYSAGPMCHPTIDLAGVARFSLRGTDISHWSRTLLRAADCPDLVFRPGSAGFSRLGAASKNAKLAVVDLTRCERADVDQSLLPVAWSTQRVMQTAA